LIFLSLTLKNHNIYLLREGEQLNEKDEFLFIDINRVKQNIFDFIVSKTNDNIELDRIIDDFIFYCIFLGNDFLPALPLITIQNKGVEFLMNTYIDVVNKTNSYLIHSKKNKINTVFLHEFFVILNDNESFKQKYKNCREIEPYKKALWSLDNLKMFKINDPIKFYEKNYHERYIDYYFKNETLFQVCKNYIDGLSFIIDYYFNDKCNWAWYYKFRNSVFPYHLLKYFDMLTFNKLDDDNTIMTPFNQLLLTIPPTKKEILPKKYQTIMSENELLFPKDYDLDMVNKEYFYECDPIIPIIDIKTINKLTRGTRFSPKEKIKNEILEDFYFDEKK